MRGVGVAGLLAACAAAAGCGRLRFETRSAPGDATDGDASDGPAPGGDGGDAADAPAAPACTALALVDDFTSATAAAAWNPYTDSGVAMVRNGGQLVITLAANAGGSHYGGYVTAAPYDLREHCIYITCLSPPSQTGSAEFQLNVQSPGNDYAGFSVSNNKIEAATSLGGSVNVLSLGAYDPAKPLTMRLRETGGTLYYDYSTDGTTFTQQTSTVDPFSMATVSPIFQSGTFASTANPGTTVLDNFDFP